MYLEYQKIVEGKIKEKEEQIKDLENIIETLSKEKFILKRKKELQELFLEHQRQKIRDLKKEIEKLKDISPKDVASLFDLDIDLDKLDAELLGKNERENDEMVIENIEDLALVHKTKFLPINGVMYTARETKATTKSKFNLGEEECEYEYEVGNDTLHFCMNGPVADHIYGSWSDRQYGIILPFEKVDKSNLLHAEPGDTYFKNRVVLPEGSIIICPKEEKEKVRAQNPGVKVVGYDSSISLDDAIRCILMYKGYKVNKINMWGWDLDQDDKRKDDNNVIEIKEKNNIVDKDIDHFDSQDRKEASLYELSKKIISVFQAIIENGLFEKITNFEPDKDPLNSITFFGYRDGMTLDDLKYFLATFKNDLQASSVHVIPQLLDEDLALAYKLTEMFKNEYNDHLKPEFYDFIGYYLLNMLAGYELARREVLEEDRKMNASM